MISSKEFYEQLASVQKQKTETKPDYQSNRSVYNKRNKNMQAKYKQQFKRYTILFVLSIPFCMIFALAASLALVFMGVITRTFVLWAVTLINFAFLYGGILTYFMKRSVDMVNNEQKAKDANKKEYIILN